MMQKSLSNYAHTNGDVNTFRNNLYWMLPTFSMKSTLKNFHIQNHTFQSESHFVFVDNKNDLYYFKNNVYMGDSSNCSFQESLNSTQDLSIIL